MQKRVFIGIAIGTAWLLVLFFAPGWVLFSVLACVTALCQYEFYNMMSKGDLGIPCSPAWGIGMGIVWELFNFICLPQGGTYADYGLFLLAFLILLFLLRVLFMRNQRDPVQHAATTLLGFFYLPFLLVYFIRIAQWGCSIPGELSPDRSGIYLALFLAWIVKFNDVGGLAIGVPFGKHKCIPGVSPNKSWEGFFGGVAVSIGFSLGFLALAKNWRAVPEGIRALAQTLTYWQITLIGVALAVVGLLGDLVESRFKRAAGFKDSACLFSSLGGFLDMFDSLVFAPVCFYCILLWLSR